ncbi:MAG: DUF3088 domain-containing protein [Chitinophagaceae bacterium]|jgi:hypothetical protein|nr:DUF3088 domain-containing protein [Chitinophagaceae bacterium]MCA6474949.1 DUF3088 domain-containing protein [Chitinophagaceae bacterium]MCA6486900.1 DUF3088 domain-containing protein [Chitinophagaceae bacterium]MCA6497343.1 DUF3088 domain-containing protein [Chitinophagaceae bacterium]MCA6511983.1 DUF3088 domain-containing protein [Chitinophagaceae bacterium]
MDILFLLRPDFTDSLRDQAGKLYYCPDCALIEGVLSYYPHLRQQIDIRYIDFPHPRKEIVDLVGDSHQGCPNLILDTAHHDTVDASLYLQYGGRLYTTDPKLVLSYFSDSFGIPIAHF